MNHLKVVLATVALATCGLAQSAVYTSEAAFDAANPGLATVTFPGSFGSKANPSTIGGVTAMAGTDLWTGNASLWGNSNALDSLFDNKFGGVLTLTFAPAKAVGFYVAGSYYADQTLTISFFSGATQLFSASPTVGGVYANHTFSFYGVDGIGSIDKVVLSAAGNQNAFPNVGPLTFGTSAVPEPTTWAMMIAGLGLVGASLRRRAAKLTFA